MRESGEQKTGEATEVLSDAFFDARKGDLIKRLGRGRYEHTLGVAKTAVGLARLYGVDEKKARLAGLLHDWDKSYDDVGIRQHVRALGLTMDSYVFNEMPQLLHGPTAAAELERAYPQLPPDVIQAIERHTAGAVGMSDLDMVVYIADALEPGRDYRGLGVIRDLAGVVSLEEMYLTVLRHVFLNLVERRKRIHPQTIEVWNYYIVRSRKAADDEKQKGTR